MEFYRTNRVDRWFWEIFYPRSNDYTSSRCISVFPSVSKGWAHLKFDNLNTDLDFLVECAHVAERDPRLGWLILARVQRMDSHGAPEHTKSCACLFSVYLRVDRPVKPLHFHSVPGFTPIYTGDNVFKGFDCLFRTLFEILGYFRGSSRGHSGKKVCQVCLHCWGVHLVLRAFWPCTAAGNSDVGFVKYTLERNNFCREFRVL